MKAFETKLLSLYLAAACWCATGCTAGDEHMPAEETDTDKVIPKQLLEPEFLQSLRISVSNDPYRWETFPQPLRFPSDSPESKRARELLLWLLSLKDVERLPLGYEARLPVRVSYCLKEEPLFWVSAEPSVGGELQIHVREKPGATWEMVRCYSCDKRIVQRIADFWDACSRRRGDGNEQ